MYVVCLLKYGRIHIMHTYHAYISCRDLVGSGYNARERPSRFTLALNPGLPRTDFISQPWRKSGSTPDFSPRLRDKVWARKAWVRG